jgi:hypothetical protein
VLLPPDAPLAGALRQSSAWHLVYDDGVALIFRLAQAAPWPLQLGSAGSSSGGFQSVIVYRKDNQDDDVLEKVLER